MLTAFNQLCYNTQRQWSSYMQVAVKSGVVKNKASFAVNSCGQSFANHWLSLLSIPLSQWNKPNFLTFFFFPNSWGAFYLFNTPFKKLLIKVTLIFIKEKKNSVDMKKKKNRWRRICLNNILQLHLGNVGLFDKSAIWGKRWWSFTPSRAYSVDLWISVE